VDLQRDGRGASTSSAKSYVLTNSTEAYFLSSSVSIVSVISSATIGITRVRPHALRCSFPAAENTETVRSFRAGLI
jgi:hypothetical protein